MAEQITRIHPDKHLRAIFRENRKSQDTREKIDFFFFCQNIPFSTLIQEKIVLGSSDSLYGRNYKKFEKSIFLLVFRTQNNGIRPQLREKETIPNIKTSAEYNFILTL